MGKSTRCPLEAITERDPFIAIERLERLAAPLHQLHLHTHFSALLIESRAGQPATLVFSAPGEQPDGFSSGERGWMVVFRGEAIDEARSQFDFFLARHGDPRLHPYLRTREHRPMHVKVPARERRRWARRFESLEQELRGRAFGYQRAARAHLSLLLLEGARLAPVPARARAVHDPRIVQVLAFIDRRFAAPISLVDVARELDFSPGYLTSLVRAQTGRTVLAWIVERRLAEARKLLHATALPVEVIAERVGYADSTYFIRQFRRAHGQTPAQWRRERWQSLADDGPRLRRGSSH